MLILAREFASKLATPMFLADADGRLVYFNEPAEEILGRTFAEAGELPRSEWASLLRISDADGSPLPLDDLPAGVTLRERQPSHRTFRMTSLDGVERAIAATAFPLFAHADDFVGVVAIFWEQPLP